MDQSEPKPITLEQKQALIEDILGSPKFSGPVKWNQAHRTLRFLFEAHCRNPDSGPKQSEIASVVYDHGNTVSFRNIKVKGTAQPNT